MLLPTLRELVLEANLELVRRGLVLYTFGNVSGISREQGLVVIKPSGVPYEDMKPEHLVVTDLAGKIVEGTLRPSSDLPTHLVLYQAFPSAGGVAHTHSEYATAWAQAVAYSEWVWATPPAEGNAWYKTRCVGRSDDGRSVPSTIFPARSVTTRCSGFMSS